MNKQRQTHSVPLQKLLRIMGSRLHSVGYVTCLVDVGKTTPFLTSLGAVGERHVEKEEEEEEKAQLPVKSLPITGWL